MTIRSIMKTEPLQLTRNNTQAIKPILVTHSQRNIKYFYYMGLQAVEKQKFIYNRFKECWRMERKELFLSQKFANATNGKSL